MVGDVDAERAAEVAAAVGASVAPSMDAALDAADAVVIAAATERPRGAHPGVDRPGPADVLREAAGRRTSTRRSRSPRTSTASGVPFQLGFQRRFDPAYRRGPPARPQTGALGTLYAVRLAGHDPAPAHEAYIAQSGGLFRDFSIHDFDILRWMTGCEVEEVYADGAVRGFPVFAKYERRRHGRGDAAPHRRPAHRR